MIQARISRSFPPGPESAGFHLDVEFEANVGITVLFGPSGSGKTLTLDCIAGFVRPDSGRILIGDDLAFDAAARVHLRPQARHCGYVFQHHALFPNMTLRQNLAFAVQKTARLERHRRVNEMIERFHLADLAGRRPHQLSGGQKQRASIARALIGSPRALLLDEPFANLDALLRANLQTLLLELRADFRIPMLLVTHDLSEAFALGGHMLIYLDGRIAQSGPAFTLADAPASVEVARLLGFTNLFPAEILALDPGRNTSRLRILDHELTATYFPGRLIGDRGHAFIADANLRVQNRPGDNRVPVQLERAVESPGSVRLEFSPPLSVLAPRVDYEKQKDNRDWYVEFPPEAIRMVR